METPPPTIQYVPCGDCGARVDLCEGGRLANLPGTLPVPSPVLGGHNDGGIADPDPAVAREAAQDVRDALGRAAELGADVILLPFFNRGELVDGAGFDRCA